MQRFSVLVALGFAIATLASVGPVTDLSIVNDNISPDGFTRAAVLAGGTFPGTLIKANKGDTFLINVIDKLENESMLTATSIHWHGLFQHTTNWADGTAFVTQCPISAGNSFLYKFSAAQQTGTYWYHSHLQTQYCDGLRGPLVIYDPNDPQAHLYDVDDDSTVITLADWYHTGAQVLQTQAAAPLPDSNLINGMGRWPQDPTSELAVITVQRGRRYRFRLLNIACDPFYNFTIDSHNMTIIEADGQNTQPLNVDLITIYAAQRYSFVLEANQPVDNYWIRAKPSRSNDTSFNNGINSAILRYIGAPDQEPTTQQQPSTEPLNESNLHPLSNPAAQSPLFFINGTSFVPPKLPVLLQILSGNLTAQSLLPAGSVFTLPKNSTIELVMPAGVPGGPHPFHLHGHTFSVVRSAGASEYNFENPVRRDTVSIGSQGDRVTIRFDTNNPGPWFLHCHIDWHLQAGLAIVFAEDPDDTAAVNPVPQSWDQLCPDFYDN
ncbi:Laccase [Grifola frondosa]|uniref:laccase n=1 Tax=Grifola frondosa TaxID=5627 RepID=A0A1C7MAU5_GRIFR|nr:Laccase [Grifola frondosa]